MRSVRSARSTCKHTGPVVVNAVESGQRAHCLSCGFVGPVRETFETAWGAILPSENPPESEEWPRGYYA